MKGKELYGIILSHYNVFKPYIDEQAKTNRGNAIDNKINESKHKLSIIRKEYGNVGIITSYTYEYLESHGYVLFSTFSDSIVYEMQKFITLYKRSSCDFLCHISDIDLLFENFLFDIYNIHAPKASIRSTLFESYIQANNNVLSVDSFRTMLCYKELKTHTIWGVDHLYTSIIWTFDLVEKYKENIDWKRLVELSNLEWDIKKIIKYKNYIPLIINDKDSYCERFDSQKVIKDFSRFTIDDTEYIIDNIENIDINRFLNTAKFTLRPNDISVIKSKIKSIKGYWSSIDKDSYASEQLLYGFTQYLIENKNIQWSSDLLYELREDCNYFNRLPDNLRLNLVPIFEDAFKKYPDLCTILNGPVFIAKMKEGKQQNDAYSTYFTVENINLNLDKWNEILVDGEFLHTHRLSRDTYYYVYAVRTMWNFFSENKELCLTYEICKALSDLTITIGGEYEKEYEEQTYYDEGFHSKNVNALEYFAHHKFKDDGEIEKLFNDEVLFLRMLEYKNKSIIHYCLKSFFDDYSLEKFLKVIQSLGIGDNVSLM